MNEVKFKANKKEVEALDQRVTALEEGGGGGGGAYREIEVVITSDPSTGTITQTLQATYNQVLTWVANGDIVFIKWYNRNEHEDLSGNPVVMIEDTLNAVNAIHHNTITTTPPGPNDGDMYEVSASGLYSFAATSPDVYLTAEG